MRYVLTAAGASVATALVLVATSIAAGWPRQTGPYRTIVKFNDFPVECDYGPDTRDARPIVTCSYGRFNRNGIPTVITQWVEFDKRGLRVVWGPRRHPSAGYLES
jgi:hypothetical protein